MKITSIQVENFLGVRAANVTIAKTITLFAGSNFAGKSSLQEAIRMALTGESVRVGLKKDYPALVADGTKTGYAAVSMTTATGESSAAILLPSGKTNSEGYTLPSALPYLLDAQRFASLDDKARRTFLFGLMGLKTDLTNMVKRLTDKQLDAAKIERITPMLRAGFDTACTEAKTKGTEAKGAWRQLTGETYGSVKAKTWKATKLAIDKQAIALASGQLVSIDTELETANQTLGALQSSAQAAIRQATRKPALQEKADKLDRIKTKLATDEKELATWVTKVTEAQAKAGGGAQRKGLVHDLGAAVHGLLKTDVVFSERDKPKLDAAITALRSYEAEHGLVGAPGDAEANDSLPTLINSRTLMERSVANDKRDLAESEQAAADLRAIAADAVVPPTSEELATAGARVTELKGKRTTTDAELKRLQAVETAAAKADKDTAAAGIHHADVEAWDAIAQQLAPDGIPSEILMEALDPINERLLQSSKDAEWRQVVIHSDMRITADLREYALLSESEKWRVDAMLAEAISHQSGLKLLVLDRFDVLDIQGRADLLAWLEVLDDAGEIETALLFGTLKALPSDLPASVGAEWISNGRVGQIKEAA
jgi:hypothetical protein